ncbi:mediator of DNA damage checkpoint protein 1 isoform X2 [Osmerus eperlanus]|uniref:mediator of DNA damage checkpoint protein 1 isoform X2 n=1 Tax=Osmerus eperlanus TaxID=29151 RepID=UPI002E167429
MDATQQILDDSILESEEEEEEGTRGEPLAKLRVFKNLHIPETELPLYLGENVLGRDPTTCSLPLLAGSVSKQHTIISISVSRGKGCRGNAAMEALVWDLGSMNGTRKGRIKLTPHVRYALSEGDGVVVADIPCQYTSCPVDKMAGLRDKQSPGKKASGRRAQVGEVKGKDHLRESLRNQSRGPDTSTDAEENVNGAIDETPVVGSSTKRKTPSRTEPLSLGNGAPQPEETLVPASDSDSDGEREQRRKRNQTFIVSDSDSHRSSPNCSTFLSPTSHVIPESPITPSSSAQHKPSKRVIFSEEEKEADLVRQQPSIKRAQVIVDDSDEKQEAEEREKGRVAPGEREIEPITSGEPEVSVEQSNNVSVSTEDELPVRFELNMDSDTDVEGEEDAGPSGPAGIQAPVILKEAAPLPTHLETDPEQFHMDSDTDVEDDETSENVSDPKPSSDGHISPDRAPVIHPLDIHPDSDTDVEEDDVTSISVTRVMSTSHQADTPADHPSPAQPMGFHLDSDTDVEDEEDMDSRKGDTTSGTEETHSRTAPDSRSSTAAFELHSDSDEENILDTSSGKPTDVASDTKPLTALDPRAEDLEILSDSDLEEDASIISTATKPVSSSSPPARIPSAALANAGVTTTTTLDVSDSDTDTEALEELEPRSCSAGPAEGLPGSAEGLPGSAEGLPGSAEGLPGSAEGLPGPAEGLPGSAEGLPGSTDFRMDSDTDVEDEEAGAEGAGESLIRSPSREKAPGGTSWGDSAPPQTCSIAPPSTLEEMETQDFHCSPDPFRRPFPPALRPVVSSCSDSQEDDDFLVAETQSFVLEVRDHPSSLPEDPTALDATQPYDLQPSAAEEQDYQGEQGFRDGSFKLGLSNSSNLHSTPHGNVELENTQAYGNTTSQGRAFLEGGSDQEATQAYGGDSKESSQRSGRGRQEDFALDATQAYASLPCEEGRGEEEEDEELRSVITAETLPIADDDDDEEETQPLEIPAATELATAETVPMSACEEEEDLLGPQPSVPLRRGRSRGHKDNKEEDTQPGQVTTQQSLSETQPMTDPAEDSDDDDDDDDDEEAVVGTLRRRRPRPLEEEEETQLITTSDLLSAETQPMSSHETEEEEEEEEVSKLSVVKTRGRPQKAREAKAVPCAVSGRPARGRVTRGQKEEEKLEDCSSEPPRQTRGKRKVVKTIRTRSSRGNAGTQEEEEEEEDSEEEVVELTRRGRGRRSGKRLKQETEERERLEREQREREEVIELERKEQAEKDRLRKEKEEADRKEAEKKERMERETRELEERERLEREEQERLKQEERETLERERKEKEEAERLEKIREEKEEAERLEKIRKEKEEAEILEKIRKEKEEAERLEKIRKEKVEAERLEKIRKEKEEAERLEKIRKEKEEAERLEKIRKEKVEAERLEKIRKEKVEAERLEKIKKEKEEAERLKQEREEREEKERLEQERAEKEEKERLMKEEKKRLEREEKERSEKQFEREERESMEKIKEKEEEERLERQRLEKERTERELAENKRLEKEREERLEMEKKEKEERERKDREKKEQEERKRLEETEKERKQTNEERRDKENDDSAAKTSTRTRRATSRRTAADPPTAEAEPAVPPSAGVQRTRSRSTSVGSEQSTSSVSTRESRGRGRGRAGRNGSPPASADPPQPGANRRRRRKTLSSTVEVTVRELLSGDVPARRTRSRSNSTSSLSSEVSACSVSSQGRGRGRKTETTSERDSHPPLSSQDDQASAPKPTARGRRSRKPEESQEMAPEVGSQPDSEKAESQEPGSTRGRRRAKNRDEPSAASAEEEQTSQVAAGAREHLQSKGRGGGKFQKEIKPVEAESSRGKGRKRELEKDEEELEEVVEMKFKIPRGKARGQQGGGRGTGGKDEEKEDIVEKEEQPAPTAVGRKGRTSSAQGKKKRETEEATQKDGSESLEEGGNGVLETKARGSLSVPQGKSEPEEESTSSSNTVDQHAGSEEIPTAKTPRKRAAPLDSPVAKAARLSSSSSPASSQGSPASARQARAAGQTVKVLFTGLVDEVGERVVSRLGGSMARGVADMTHLVTDKVRRTVKFLCAMARGVPVVTTDWLHKSGKAGSFLCPDGFLVKDAEQEKKFSFCLQDSLRAASQQRLLQGYEIHVTRSVKPEPAQMKDIISCSGAHFLPKMPSAHKPQTVVVSCGEDQALCAPALAASLPLLSAEFLLTGVLQQTVDLQAHALPVSTKPQEGGRGTLQAHALPASTKPQAGGQGRGKKKS